MIGLALFLSACILWCAFLVALFNPLNWDTPGTVLFGCFIRLATLGLALLVSNAWLVQMGWRLVNIN